MNNRVIYHIAPWIFLFVFWFSVYSLLEPTLSIAAALAFVCVVFIIFTFYTTTHILVPHFVEKKKYRTLLLVFFAFLTLVGCIYAYCTYTVYEIMYRHLNWDYFKLVFNSCIQLFYVAAISGGIKFFRDKYKAESDLERLAKENAENELKFLKAQLNPHFVFNSLNLIYFQIPSEAKVARDALLTFSTILRYQLYECNVDRVSIFKETEYIKSYINIQQARKKDNYRFSIDDRDVIEDFQIAPLVIMPFVENAVKHISTHKTDPNVLKVRLAGDRKCFALDVFNTKDIFANKVVEPYNGIGLSNIKRRLELLYPNRFTLDIEEKKDSYKVMLNIHL